MVTHLLTEKVILNSDFKIILPIVRVKNNVENLDWFFLNKAEASFLVKLVLIMRRKCSQAYIAHNSVNRSHNEQRFGTN